MIIREKRIPAWVFLSESHFDPPNGYPRSGFSVSLLNLQLGIGPIPSCKLSKETENPELGYPFGGSKCDSDKKTHAGMCFSRIIIKF